MKLTKLIPSIIAIISLTFFLSSSAIGQCKAKQIAGGCKSNIKKPFKYDSYAINEFVFNDKPKEVEVVFTAFSGQKYKVIFCSSGFDEKVTMNIYDKPSKIKNNRHLLWDNSKGIDSDFWSFEPPKTGNYYIEYSVPAAIKGKEKKGCVVMLVGYTDPAD